MKISLQRLTAALSNREWSLGKRIGVGYFVASVLLVGLVWLAAYWLYMAADSTHAVILVAASLAGVACNMVAAYWVTKWIYRQIGCEPSYATWLAKKISLGNLAVDIKIDANDQSSVLAAIAAMRDSLDDIVGHARSGAETVAQTSDGLANATMELSDKTQNQVEMLNNTKGAVELFSVAIEQNKESISQAHAIAKEAMKAANDGGAAVSAMADTMSAISRSSRKVSDIVSVIDGIAFQTNILALNAAVEAARAGDQGRGFAVVAAEVRRLSTRSATAAKEIAGLIRESLSQVSRGEELANNAGSRTQEMLGTVVRVNDVVASIDTETDKQTEYLQRINIAVAELDIGLGTTTALVGQAGRAAETMQDQAGNLAQVVCLFKLRTDSKVGGGEPSAERASSLPSREVSSGQSHQHNTSGYKSRIIRFGYGLAAPSNQGRAARFFAEDLARRTGGKLKLKEFGDATLGNDDSMQEALIQGSLEMMVGSTATLTKYVSDFSVFDLPFIFSNEEEADKVLDGELGQRLSRKLLPHGFVGLGYWENGFRNLTNSKRIIKRIEDLEGIRLRVMQNPIYIDMFSSFGAIPVPLPFADLFAAMESGSVDGQENPVNTIQSCKFYEAQKHLSLTRHVYSPWIVTASRSWWESLSPEERSAIEASSEAAREYERKDSRRSTVEALAFLKNKGMTITEISDAEARRMREKIQNSLKKSAYAEQLKWITDALAR